ncbi:unnamed protein product [Sphagnum jensenii]|uniref:UDP-glycosyltransferase n=1 Tax=Sphagnum jensenii TaxID=128206 RepID=A0ABP0X156_9BRYO
MSTLNGSRTEMIAGSPPPAPPHLVMVPPPGLGHENPFLQAARRIADEGIIVTYVSTDRHISRVLNRPDFVHLRSSSSFQLLRFVNLRDGMGHLAEREFYLIMRTQEVVTKLTQLLEEVVIDLCSPGPRRRGLLHLHLLPVAFCMTCSPLGPKTLLCLPSLLPRHLIPGTAASKRGSCSCDTRV